MKIYLVYNRESYGTESYFIVRANNKKDANYKAYERCNKSYPLRSFDAHLIEDCLNDEEKEYGWKDVFMIQ